MVDSTTPGRGDLRRQIVVTFLVATVVVAVAYVASEVAQHVFGVRDVRGLLRPLDVDAEPTFANWLSSIGWFGVGLLVHRRRDELGGAAIAGSVVALVMSVEESVDRRTPLIGLLLDYARDAPLLQRAALVATGALVLLAALRLLRLLAVELRPVARRVAALGLVMWVTGMLVVDKVAVHLLAGDPAVYDVGVGVEEILELLALACLLWAFSDDPPRFDAPMSPPAATSTQRPTSSHGSNAIP